MHELEPRFIELEDKLDEIDRKVSALYRAQRHARIFKALYWAIIIGVAVGAFYFLQPYFEAINGIIKAITGQESGVLANLELLVGSQQ